MREIEFNRRWPSSEVRAHGRGFVRRAAIWLALIAVISFNTSALAATVNASQGQVLVNAGQGYRLVEGSTQLDPGATVVANPGASAQVVYPDGCAVTVQPGSVYVIATQSPCQTGATGVSGTKLAIGAALLGGGGAAAILLLKDKILSP